MRQAEQHGLSWQNVNLDRGYVDLFKTKNDRARRVPLSGRAIEAFKALQGYPKPVPVETTHGVLVAFVAARELAGLKDLRYHDIRHEALSRLFEFTDLRDHEIMAISGHLTSAMLSRYTHLRADRLGSRLPGGIDNRRG
jgi:integrase